MKGKFVKAEYILQIISILESELEKIQTLIEEEISDDGCEKGIRALYAKQSELKTMIEYFKK